MCDESFLLLDYVFSVSAGESIGKPIIFGNNNKLKRSDEKIDVKKS